MDENKIAKKVQHSFGRLPVNRTMKYLKILKATFHGSKSNRVVLIKSLKGNASAFPFFFLFFCSNNVAKILLNQNSHTKVTKGSKTECHSLDHFNQVILPFKFSVRIGVF
jgi:hypothetical protein